MLIRTSTSSSFLLVLAVLLSPGCGGGETTSPNGGSGGSSGSGSGGSSAGSGGSSGSGGSVGSGGSTGSGGAVPDAGPGPTDTGGGVDTGGGADSGPPAGDTWDSFAKGFFTTYCVSCHNDDNSGAATRDYHMLANVMKEKAEIACGTAKSAADATARGCKGFPPAKQFPVGSGPKPSDADRDRILKWIDANTP